MVKWISHLASDQAFQVRVLARAQANSNENFTESGSPQSFDGAPCCITWRVLARAHTKHCFHIAKKHHRCGAFLFIKYFISSNITELNTKYFIVFLLFFYSKNISHLESTVLIVQLGSFFYFINNHIKFFRLKINFPLF